MATLFLSVGRLGFARSTSSVLAKKASYGEVLIEFIPGDADAMTHETPLSALLGV